MQAFTSLDSLAVVMTAWVRVRARIGQVNSKHGGFSSYEGVRVLHNSNFVRYLWKSRDIQPKVLLFYCVVARCKNFYTSMCVVFYSACAVSLWWTSYYMLVILHMRHIQATLMSKLTVLYVMVDSLHCLLWGDRWTSEEHTMVLATCRKVCG